MKVTFFRKFLGTALVCLGFLWALAWGSWGHEHINRAAVFALPAEIRPFFYNHLDFITEEAGIPDLRKYTINDKAEFARHYINLESFGDQALDSLPRTMPEARKMYPDSLLQKNGILPWYMQEVMGKLTQAFRAKRKTEILFLAADLGHYIGDAHMPLHTALNHDGQLTGQRGIHALWESQLPELFGGQYNLCTGPAVYITDVTAACWDMMRSTHQLKDTLLITEQNLKASYPPDQIYLKDSSGNIVKNKFNQPVHSFQYAKKYHELLHGMVERQLRRAITMTANFWYTAWVNAGRPDMRGLEAPSMTRRNAPFLEADYKTWQHGKLTGIQPDREF